MIRSPNQDQPRLCRTCGPPLQAGCFVSGLRLSKDSAQITSRHRAFRTVVIAPSSTMPLDILPWVSLGDEPFSPEGWDGDQAVKAGVNAPQAPLEQGGEGSGIAPGSAMAG